MCKLTETERSPSSIGGSSKKDKEHDARMDIKQNTGQAYKQAALPPGHSVAAIVAMIGVFSRFLPSIESIDAKASPQVFTNRIFSRYISVETLIRVRLLFSLVVFATTIYSMIPRNGWNQTTNYLPGSKLRKTTIAIQGVKVLLPYTSWCWNLLGISCALNAYVAYQAQTQNANIHPAVLRIALLAFQIAAPNALLVSAVVKYVIWPNIIKQGGSTNIISSFRTLIWHNANVLIAMMEVALLGGLPLHLSHFAVVPFYGIAYIIFTWSMQFFWAPQECGPQFIYFFLDTTLGRKTTIAMIMLLAVIMSFFLIFALIGMLLEGGTLLTNTCFVLAVCAAVCRFRD